MHWTFKNNTTDLLRSSPLVNYNMKKVTAEQDFEILEETKKVSLLKEDYENDWWAPSSVDGGSLKNKLLRVGCRPLKRKHLLCLKSEMDLQTYATCAVIKNQCYFV